MKEEAALQSGGAAADTSESPGRRRQCEQAATGADVLFYYLLGFVGA